MKMLKALFSFSAAFILIFVLNVKWGQLPPLGKFFDPFHGFWSNAEISQFRDNLLLHLNGLHAPVRVRFDDRGVPHIFAENEHDLYFAQGFVAARDRLWQMEFQTHAAAGRLSEILGNISLGAITTLDYDLHQRRIGMTYGARNTLATIENDSLMSNVLAAHAAGVNAYIQSLSPRDYPLEYKIMDYAPEPWTAYKTCLFLKLMSWTLAGRSSDLQMSNTLAKFGPEIVADLFPDYPQNMEPVIPTGTPWSFQPLPLRKPAGNFSPRAAQGITPFEPGPHSGSNNWAVSGKKTASGFPILANDPHLDLRMPSIWYEVQLVAPGVNVYGVSFPAAPGVIIGFNAKIAWGVTNSAADVMDWYEIKFKDENLREYFHDGQWKPTKRVLEEIKIRNGNTVTDTVIFTHHGPVPLRTGQTGISRQVPPLHALRWLAHDGSGNELLTFYRLNRAGNYEDFVEALKSYACPAQNFVFADEKDIAIWHNGYFPAKWPGQGKYIGDGSDPRYDWSEWIPHQQKPHIKNPKREFVSSANQNAADPDYPYYLGWDFAPYYRGARINEWLRSTGDIRPEDFRIMQLDNKNLKAEAVLPSLLTVLAKQELTAPQNKCLEELQHWDYFSDADKIAPSIFSVWWEKLYNGIWKDEFGDENLYWPSSDRTASLLAEEPEATWYDDVTTIEVENRDELILRTFKMTISELTEKYGPMNEKWQWGVHKSTDILHAARIPGFGKMDLNVGGDLAIINATGKHEGPSWRMVVALGPDVQGWGIYPGGQSGNPGSKRYDDFVDAWAAGELADLLFLKSATEQNVRLVAELDLMTK